MSDENGRMGALSVSELNEQIKSLLEATFCAICVHGEVSNLTYHTSGHVYLTLKDSASSIRAVIFKGNASRLRFRIEPGMDVTIFGALSLYAPRGEYQILVQSAEPTGIGARTLAFNQLKEELRKLGYFEAKNKKLAVACLILSLLVCVGRVIALVHTPLDVAGGLLIACVGVVWYVPKFRLMAKRL